MRRLTTSLVALALLAVACAGPPGPEVVGGELFDVSCARCHGGNLEGGIGPSLAAGSKAATELNDEQIFFTIKIGPGAMPAFGRLTDVQIASLVVYLRERQAQS